MRHALASCAVVVAALAVSAATAAPSALEFYAVVWAPSHQIVFVASGGRIYVISPSGGRPRLLATGSGDMVSIARDGRVLYSKSHNLLTIPVAGGKPRNLGLGSNGIWSPDGRRIAYTGDNGVIVEDADGRHKRLVARSRYPELTGFPTWSPDSRKLAYVACRAPYLSSGCEHSTAFDVYVIGVDGSDKHRVTPKAGFPQCPAWSSAAKLAFYVDDNFVSVVQKGGGLRTFRPGDCPVWAPNGRRLAVGTATGAYLMNFDGSNRKRITVAPGSFGGSRAVAWSPDGKRLAIVDGTDHPHLWVVRANGSGRRRLL